MFEPQCKALAEHGVGYSMHAELRGAVTAYLIANPA